MRKILSLLVLLGGFTSVICAQENMVADFRIQPTDVVQDSIKQFTFGTNGFVVRWTFTKAGAQKMLAFHEAHEGEKTTTSIGAYTSPTIISTFHPIPPYFLTYAQWKEGWLKRRTDKILGKNKNDAQIITAGLTFK
jgi:hypothetical protein